MSVCTRAPPPPCRCERSDAPAFRRAAFCSQVENDPQHWGGNITLFAAANLYRRPIWIWGVRDKKEIHPSTDQQAAPGTGPQVGEPLELAHLPEFHFMSVVPGNEHADAGGGPTDDAPADQQPRRPLTFKEKADLLKKKIMADDAIPARIRSKAVSLTGNLRRATTLEAFMSALRVPVCKQSEHYGRLWELLKGATPTRIWCRTCTVLRGRDSRLAGHIEIGTPLHLVRMWLCYNPVPTGDQLVAANRALQQENSCLRMANDRVAEFIATGRVPVNSNGVCVILADGAADG